MQMFISITYDSICAKLSFETHASVHLQMPTLTWLLLAFGLWAPDLIWALTDYNQEGHDCWEVCFFEASQEPEHNDAVDFIYTLVEKLRFMRMYYGVKY